jgi:hypothetical protein
MRESAYMREREKERVSACEREKEKDVCVY